MGKNHTIDFDITAGIDLIRLFFLFIALGIIWEIIPVISVGLWFGQQPDFTYILQNFPLIFYMEEIK